VGRNERAARSDKQGEAVVEELRKAKKLTIDEKGAVIYRL
jgi:hypothetical protein